jgi:3-oxoacyl-[acyl-carrier-protein] synthase II
MQMNRNPIVISSIGTVSPLGTGLDQVTAALSSPRRTIDVQNFEYHSFEKPLPCFRLTDIDPVAILGKKGLRNKDDATKMLLCAVELGFKTLLEESPEESRPGLCIGTAFGSVQSIGDFLSDSIVNGVNTVNPQSFANTVINAPTGNANIRYLARNLSSTISTGFNSGLDAVIYAFDLLQQGYFEQIIAGGLEEVSYYALLGCMRSGVLSPSGTARPFASESDGIVMGEGCALFLMETAASAQRRNAAVLAEIAGCANGFDPAPGRQESSDGSVYKQVVFSACAQAGIDPGRIDCIASGGSGNPTGDALEAAGIAAVFGTDTAVIAYKSSTGECYGASGALTILCALADMKANRIHGIPGTPYPSIASISPVFGSVEKTIHYMLVSSYSCDGNCSAVILKKGI